MSGVIPNHRIGATDTAMTLGTILRVLDECILSIEWMTFWAMRFFGIECYLSNSSVQICAMRDCFQVIRVHARGISAEMVNDQFLRDTALGEFIRNTMNILRFVDAAYFESEQPISGREFIALPFPTIGAVVDFYHSPESNVPVSAFSHYKSIAQNNINRRLTSLT